MDIDGDEEHRSAIGVKITDHPAVIHIAHDRFNRGEGHIGMRRIMHREHNAGQNLSDEHEGENAAEGPQIIEVPRIGEHNKGRVDQTNNRKTAFKPLSKSAGGYIGGGSAHGFIP